MTKEEFKRRAIEVHGNEYSYEHVSEKVLYDGKVYVTCKKHGDFMQSTAVHLAGSGCPQCYGTHKKTTEQFIEEAKRVHGDKYDYSLVDYKTARDKVVIICPIHGEFEQEAQSHLKGCGCRQCVQLVVDTNKFIAMAKEIYGDEYTYGKTVYIDSRTHVCVTHKILGDINVLPLKFLKNKKEIITDSIDGEEWRDVVGYEDYYQVSNKGRVRSKDRISKSNKNGNKVYKGRIIKGITNSLGYNRIVLKIRPNSKIVFAHRLVAEAFIPNPNNYPIINHKDENPQNNNVENLEWCDALYNNTYGNALKKAKNTRIKNGIAKVVKKIDKDGNIVALFASKQLAAKIEGIGVYKIECCCLKGQYINEYSYSFYDKEKDGNLEDKITYFKE